MRIAGTLLGLVTGALLCFSASGGDLAKLSKELDFIEYSFVYAALQPSGSENRQQVETRIRNFHTSLLKFREKLIRNRVPGIPNFLAPAVNLKGLFDELGNTPSTAKMPRFKGTSLGHYSRAYNEYLRDISRIEGKKNKNRRTTPTLKTIPLENYKAWLDRTTQDYIQSLRRISQRNNRSSRSGYKSKNRRNNRNQLSMTTINRLEEYIVNIAKLRICLVQIAQNKFYKE